ncbi:MAG: NADH:flavin oxidoreductase [Desulfobacterales bacterium]|jgi:2,4-dienoyl-CoA reductase-like NADH-dependent reductase (Old Yellow Enzyme family)
MPTLFEETTVNGMTLKNRLVRSATWEGMCAPDGRPTEKLAACYAALARGGVGLIITGFAFVSPEGKQMPGKMGLHTEAFAEDFKQLTAAVHEAGGVIAVQLVHAGGQTSSKTIGRHPVAPSSVKVDQFPEPPEALTKGEIERIVDAFGEAAGRAKRYGFDGVQLHGAHGYLINQFLSPLTNRRDDEYGGRIENRCRFLFEVYDRVRTAVGPGFPVLIKLNAADNLVGGLEVEDALFAAAALGQKGIDAIEVSAGTPASGLKGPARARIDRPGREAYHLGHARKVKERVECPVMVVGGFRSVETVEKAVGETGIDYVSIARPLIREPNLPARWYSGDRSPAACISCNGCFKPGLEEGGIYCVAEKKNRKQKEGKK